MQPLRPPRTPPEPEAPKPRRKLPRFLVRAAATLVVLAAALCLVAVVAFRDSLNMDSVKRWFTYRSLIRSDSGRADSFPYGGDLTDTFAVLDGDLLVCSRNAISLYSGSGTQYINESVGMENPVVTTNGSLAAVYDAGGSSLYVLGQRTLVWSADDLESILSARLNKNGQLTVVTQSSGYRGSVTVYDAAYSPVMRVDLTSAFVMDAALSDDGHTLAILTVGQSGGAFATTLELYDMSYASGQYAPDLTCQLGGGVVLETRHTASAVWALGDRGLTVTAHDGRSSGVSWADKHLRRYTLSGDGFAAVLLGKYRAGSQSELWVVDEQGERRTLEINEQVLSISASGRYVAVLTGDRLDIYTDQLELYDTLDGTQGARTALLMPDGSAILISADSAGFYIP
ncbi:MAG: hypothetical protein HFF20_11480 [Oscillospiraceae bacterium]|nr:hypothetical protein [Oscillospiraceae bacterium]MCI9549821.1 hypothetical protein [Oscillospiraceae bacterium]